MAKKNIVPLKELNLTDRFLFDEVMEDPINSSRGFKPDFREGNFPSYRKVRQKKKVEFRH